MLVLSAVGIPVGLVFGIAAAVSGDVATAVFHSVAGYLHLHNLLNLAPLVFR